MHATRGAGGRGALYLQLTTWLRHRPYSLLSHLSVMCAPALVQGRGLTCSTAAAAAAQAGTPGQQAAVAGPAAGAGSSGGGQQQQQQQEQEQQQEQVGVDVRVCSGLRAACAVQS